GVTNDTLAVTAELRVVRGEQHQAGQDALTKGVDHLGRPEVGLYVPVGGDRAEVDHARVPDRVDQFSGLGYFVLVFRGHGTSWPYIMGRTAVSVPEPRLPGFPAPALPLPCLSSLFLRSSYGGVVLLWTVFL